MRDYFLEGKGSLFDYFWKGFNSSLITIGVHELTMQEVLVHSIIEKLFEYLLFHEASYYTISLSAFTIYNIGATEKFMDLLFNLADSKGIANIEVRTREEGIKIVKEIFNVYNKSNTNGHLFIRLMIYNSKSKIVSCLQLANIIRHIVVFL